MFSITKITITALILISLSLIASKDKLFLQETLMKYFVKLAQVDL